MARLLVSDLAMRVASDLWQSGSARKPRSMDYDRDTYAAELGVASDTLYRAIADLVEMGAVDHHTTVRARAGKIRTLIVVPEHWLWAAVAAERARAEQTEGAA